MASRTAGTVAFSTPPNFRCFADRRIATGASRESPGESDDETSSHCGDRVGDMPFGSDWRRLWVGNRQEWQIARAARRNLVLRGDGAALDRREHQLCHPAFARAGCFRASRRPTTARCRQNGATIDAWRRLGPGASPPPSVRRSCARSHQQPQAVIMHRLLSIDMAQHHAKRLDIGCKSRFTSLARSPVHSGPPIWIKMSPNTASCGCYPT
jgi:hypothetical protein